MQPESLKQNQNWERSDQPYIQLQKTQKKCEFQKETNNVESLAGRCAPSSDFVADGGYHGPRRLRRIRPRGSVLDSTDRIP
jgi:hypothetical protein